jgi:diguanylate cyclase (GGDEF)-like protein/PAS domain S-box-containing protein
MRNSLIVVSLTFIGTLAGFLFIRNDPQTTSFEINLFALIMIIQVAVMVLIIIGRQLIARILALVFLWVTFTVIGLAQPGASVIMVAGYLLLTIISGYAFHGRGVLIATITSTVLIGAIGWVNISEMSIFTIPLFNPLAALVIDLVIMFIGGAYLLLTLRILDRSYAEVQDYQRRYRALFEDSVDTILIMDLDFKIMDINQSGLELTGYTLEEVTGMQADDLIVASESIKEAQDNLLKFREVGSFEHQIRDKFGNPIEVESAQTLVTDEDENILYIQMVIRDVRSRKRVEEYLNEYKERYKAMYERGDYGFLLIDGDLNLVAANQQAADMLGCSLSDLHHQPAQDFLRAGSYLQLKSDIERLRQTTYLEPKQYRIVTRTGHSLWVEANLGLVDTNGDQANYVQLIMRDISDQKLRERQLMNALQEMETLAMTDPLTGLHNRRSIERYGQMVMDRSFQEGKAFCVILIDVNQLKKINDTFGHHSGDLALSRCAQVLSTSKRRDDAVGRWGGDEFLMILPNTNLHDAELAAQRIRQQVNKVQIGTGSEAIRLAVSMGIAGFECLNSEPDCELQDLIDLADQAMYEGKQYSGSQINVAN